MSFEDVSSSTTNQEEIEDPSLEQEEFVEEHEEENIDPFEAREQALEDKARQQGWRPFEEWDGDPNQWVGAETFVVRGELYDKTKQLSKRLNDATSVIDELRKHNEKLARKEAEEELKDIRRQKALALENEDYETVVDLDEKMNDYRSKVAPEKEEEEQPQVNPDFEEWQEQNQWYNNNRILRGAADALADQFAEENPDVKDFNAVVQYVEREMKKEFPDHFGVKKKPRGGVNEPSYRGNTGSRTKATARRLTSEQRKIGEKFVNMKAFKNLDEYAAQLSELGELN